MPEPTYTITLPAAYRKSLRWRLTWPMRSYVRYSPLRRGTGLIQRLSIERAIPDDLTLSVKLPCGDILTMNSRERIARHLMISGHFEDAELAACTSLARPGTVAMDVGANVGIFALTMACAVGASGHVVAVEPLASNYERIAHHALNNKHGNITIVQAAASSTIGHTYLDPTVDPAFVSVGLASEDQGQQSLRVETTTLDDIWTRLGRPSVSFIKIDVEGSECEVLDGAQELLRTTSPALLLEVNDEKHMAAARQRLDPLGYVAQQPSDFQSWNYLFTCAK